MKRRFIAIMVIVTTMFVPCVMAGGATIAEIEKLELPGVVNFSRMEKSTGFAGSRVGFGGATQDSAMTSLKNKGYATVINLRLADEEGVDVEDSLNAADAAGLNYIHLPFDPENPAPDVVEKFLAAVGDEANQPVFIHCNSATRVAALWMVGRMLEDGWEIDAASQEIEVIADKPPEAMAFATVYLASLGK